MINHMTRCFILSAVIIVQGRRSILNMAQVPPSPAERHLTEPGTSPGDPPMRATAPEHSRVSVVQTIKSVEKLE